MLLPTPTPMPLVRCLTWLLLALLPCQAMPPRAGGAVNRNRIAKVEAAQAQAAFHREQALKARNGRATASWLPDLPTLPTLPSAPRMGRCLAAGLVGLLLAADPASLVAMAQPVAIPIPAFGPQPPPLFGAMPQPLLGAMPVGLPGALPLVNLSAGDPSSVLAAQGVNLALARANASGTLPPLADLNAALARANPQGTSILSTLPAPLEPLPPLDQEGTDPSGTGGGLPPQLPSFLLNAPGNLQASGMSSSLSKDYADAQTALSVAQLTDAFYILEGVGNQLLAAAAASVDLTGNATVAEALEAAGFECASVGFYLAAAASFQNTAAAQRTIAYLEEQAQAQAQAQLKAAENPPAGSKPAEAAALAGALAPDLVFGVWKRLENTLSNQTILYQFSPTAFVKVNVTTDAEGDDDLETEYHPGAVTAYMSYKRRAGSATPDLKGGKIKLRVVAGDGGRLVMTFLYLQVEGVPAGTVLDILVQQDEEKKAFFRIAEG